jgi:hypothetical protein
MWIMRARARSRRWRADILAALKRPIDVAALSYFKGGDFKKKCEPEMSI